MAVLKGSPEPLMEDPVQHVFFDHLRNRETYSLLLLSDRLPCHWRHHYQAFAFLSNDKNWTNFYHLIIIGVVLIIMIMKKVGIDHHHLHHHWKIVMIIKGG